MNKEILEYIKENRGFDTSDNITRKLISQGYNFTEIQAVWEDIEIEERAKMPRPRKLPKAVSPDDDSNLPDWIFTALKIILLILVAIIILSMVITVIIVFDPPFH